MIFEMPIDFESFLSCFVYPSAFLIIWHHLGIRRCFEHGSTLLYKLCFQGGKFDLTFKNKTYIRGPSKLKINTVVKYYGLVKFEVGNCWNWIEITINCISHQYLSFFTPCIFRPSKCGMLQEIKSFRKESVLIFYQKWREYSIFPCEIMSK